MKQVDHHLKTHISTFGVVWPHLHSNMLFTKFRIINVHVVDAMVGVTAVKCNGYKCNGYKCNR